jgi:hypothetical protein
MANSIQVRNQGFHLGEIRLEEGSLRRLEEQVNRSVEGLDQVLGIIGTTLREKKPHEADLFQNVRILRSHMKSIASLVDAIGKVLKESDKTKEPVCQLCSLSLVISRVEGLSDIAAFALNILNNVIKTIDLSASSSFGWVALAAQGLSEICSKLRDRINVNKLSRAQMMTKLRELEGRLSILDKAETMGKLFKLFEMLRRGEKKPDRQVLLSGVQLCDRIPERLKRYIQPEELMMQILAVSKIDLNKINTRSRLGRAVVRVIENNREEKFINRLSVDLTNPPSIEIGSISDLTVKELVVRWNNASYQIETALHAVDDILTDRLKEPGEIHFGAIIEILGRETALLKQYSKNADQLVRSKKGWLDHISYENKLLISSFFQSLVTVSTDASFAWFNLINPETIKGVWISGVITLLGPVFSKINKAAAEAIIEEEFDRQLLIKMREGQSFIESTETFAFTLDSIQNMQSNLNPDELTELLETCRAPASIKGIVSEGLLKGIMAKQIVSVTNGDQSVRKRVELIERKARQESKEREVMRNRLREKRAKSAEERLRRIRSDDASSSSAHIYSKHSIESESNRQHSLLRFRRKSNEDETPLNPSCERSRLSHLSSYSSPKTLDMGLDLEIGRYYGLEENRSVDDSPGLPRAPYSQLKNIDFEEDKSCGSSPLGISDGGDSEIENYLDSDEDLSSSESSSIIREGDVYIIDDRFNQSLSSRNDITPRDLLLADFIQRVAQVADVSTMDTPSRCLKGSSDI